MGVLGRALLLVGALRVEAEDLVREPPHCRLAEGAEGSFNAPVQRVNIAVALSRDDVAEHLVVHDHVPGDEDAGDKEGRTVGAKQPGGVDIHITKTEQDEREEWNGRAHRELADRRRAMIRAAPEDHVQQEAPDDAGKGSANIEEGIDGGSLLVGKAVQLQPHGQVAERKPGCSAKDSLPDDHQEGGEAKDLAELWSLLDDDRQHCALVSLLGLLDKDANCNTHKGAYDRNHKQRKLPARDAAHLCAGHSGGKGSKGSLAQLAREDQAPEGLPPSVNAALVCDEAEEQRLDNSKADAIHSPEDGHTKQIR